MATYIINKHTYYLLTYRYKRFPAKAGE